MDTIFYFMHRLMHTNFLYNYVHYFHHKFRPIDSWISRTSHWVDSNIENVAFTVPFILVPTYFPLMFILLLFTYVWGCYIHNNKQLFHNRYINGAHYHNIHHKYGKRNYNFAYYFTFWDKLLNTYLIVN